MYLRFARNVFLLVVLFGFSAGVVITNVVYLAGPLLNQNPRKSEEGTVIWEAGAELMFLFFWLPVVCAYFFWSCHKALQKKLEPFTRKAYLVGLWQTTCGSVAMFAGAFFVGGGGIAVLILIGLSFGFLLMLATRLFKGFVDPF